MKFSIIIPVYNVELYVERCILSCLNQNLDKSEYEIILVNDGSTDNSLEILKKYEQEYNNIKYLSQSNKGLSEARNQGLKLACGEFIWFVDSDDWIEKNCLLELFSKCKQFNLDVLIFDAIDFDGYNFKRRNSIHPTFDYINIIEGIEFINFNKIVFSVCVKIYNRDFLLKNQLLFLKGIYHEDNEFTPRMFYFAKRVFCLDKALYYVFHNPKSITRSVIPKKTYDLIIVALSHINFLETNKMEKSQKLHFYNFIGLAINSSLQNALLDNDYDKLLFIDTLKKQIKLFKVMKKSNILKYKFEANIFLFSPRVFMLFYNLYRNSFFIKSKKNLYNVN